MERIHAIEAEVRHDVIAFTTTVAEHIGSAEDSRWLHYGLTSTDVVDTAQALQLKEASAIIRVGVLRLRELIYGSGVLAGEAFRRSDPGA